MVISFLRNLSDFLEIPRFPCRTFSISKVKKLVRPYRQAPVLIDKGRYGRYIVTSFYRSPRIVLDLPFLL